jgi:hypothetical protein
MLEMSVLFCAENENARTPKCHDIEKRIIVARDLNEPGQGRGIVVQVDRKTVMAAGRTLCVERSRT